MSWPDWLTVERVLTVAEHVTGAASILFNALLIHLVLNHARKQIGSYRYLLVAFALNDIVMSILHMIVQPIVVIQHRTFAMGTDGWCKRRFFICFYAATFSMATSVMDFHFLYRYWALYSPHRIIHFMTPKFICSAASVCLFYCLLWFSMSFFGFYDRDNVIIQDDIWETVWDEYGKNATNIGWMTTQYFRNGLPQWNYITMYVLKSITMCVMISVQFLLGALIVRFLRSNEIISPTRRRLQTLLFQALCLQTASPLFLLYIPTVIVLTLPLVTDVQSNLIGHFIPLFLSLFPLVDAIVIITYLTDWRAAFSAFVTRRLKDCEKLKNRRKSTTTTVCLPRHDDMGSPV